MARHVTIKDVARAAGVSPATVSYALNRCGTVSEATAAHVQQVADQLCYHRDQRAADLRRQRASTVGLLMARLSDPYTAEVAEALDAAARGHGYTLLQGPPTALPGSNVTTAICSSGNPVQE